jgi:hypothetical protein
MCPYSYLDVFQSLLTPLIAIVTVYIAWQQWQTNRKKLYIDLYDRRLRIYTEVKNFLRAITGDSIIDTNELLIFYSSVSEADFLFGPEISKYINEIYKHAVDLRRWNSEYRDFAQPIPEGYDHKKVCDGIDSELMWLSNQFEPTKEKFGKYLTLDDNCIIRIQHNVRRFLYQLRESRKGRSTQ